MNHPIKWLFFDIGSTLVNEQCAYKHRLKEIADSASLSYQDVYETAMSFYRKNQKGDLETARLLGVELSRWHSEDEVLYPDTAECLEKLSAKYKIGVIANQPAGTTERLKQHGILSYIDLVIASAEEGVAKPDRKIFEIALERSGCSPCEAFMIGDRIDNDIVPAKTIGMHTVWIKQGFGQYWQLASRTETPDLIVHSLTELLCYL